MSESHGTLSRLVNSLRDSFAGEHSVWTSGTDYAYDTRLLFKRRITTLYISFTNLKSYVEVNYSGFRKILKKSVPILLFTAWSIDRAFQV